jgi:hypothetical protein
LRRGAGATFRQSVIGLDYFGPGTFLGGKVGGSIRMDFYDGAVEGASPPLRVRTASVDVEWKNRSLRAGVEKPIFNPREPNSLLQVGLSPLTASGNLWRWQPQIVYEERLPLGAGTTLRAQIGALQTSEDVGVTGTAATLVRRRRPGLEGRFELGRRLDQERRLEFAPGFHVSKSQIPGFDIPSRLFSFDWFANPWQKLELTGVFFNGQNVHHFGALRQGFRLDATGRPVAAHGRGGWSQATILAANRLTFNFMAGVHDDRDSDLSRDNIGRNLTFGGNVMVRLAPNVVVSFEWLRTRTDYIGTGQRLLNRYDLALAYLF